MARSLKRHQEYEMISNYRAEHTTGSVKSTQADSPHKNADENTSWLGSAKSESSLPQTVLPFSKSSQWVKFGNTTWFLEVGAFILGTASLGAIFGVLARYNGKPVPDFPIGLRLGAIVSALATAMTVFLTTPLAAGIGQAKWFWYQRHRKVSDFELITDAGRSPFSAAEVLLRRKGGVLTSFGAFFTIMMLAVNPFTQQVIAREPDWFHYHNSSNSSMPVASNYRIDLSSNVDGNELKLRAAIYRGLLQAAANDSVFDVKPTCTTANCTWDRYRTLSVCGQCANLTNRLNVTQTGSNGIKTALLPNGFNGSDGTSTIVIGNTQAEPYLKSIAFTDATNFSITNIFAIAFPLDGKAGPFASECILRFCAETLSATVSDGELNEQRIENATPLYPNSTRDGKIYISKDWTIDVPTHNALVDYFGQLFVTNAASSSVRGLTVQGSNTERPDDVSIAVYHYMNQQSTDVTGISDLFSDLSRSMGQHVRKISHEYNNGTLHVQVSVISVQWWWMTLPVIVWVAVLAFLVASIIMTRRAGLEPWKESTTAVLFHGLSDNDRANLLAINNKPEMDETAEMLEMRLDRIDGGLNFRLR